jgi:phage terminase large subunit-like protein
LQWRADPCGFIERVLYNPAEGAPFVLLDAERAFVNHAFKFNDDGKLMYSEWLYSCPKKSGKTTFAAIVCLVVILLYGGHYPEATLAANDQDQAVGRVFEMARRIVMASPLLRDAARITQDKITFPTLNATITAIPVSFAGAAGGNQNISVFDEAWAYTSERSRRLWDELVPPPTRKIACRLTVTYAGFAGESLLLEELYRRGKAQSQVGTDLYAGDSLLMFWSHRPIAPWQDESWSASMRHERPSAYQRMVLNEFTSGDSQFINTSEWDACVQPSLAPVMLDRTLHVWVGVDASVKRDATALVACTLDKKTKCVRLVTHHIFTPRPGDPIDFEATVEATLLDWNKRYHLRKVFFDPFQMVAVAQRLAKAGIRIEEFPQTLPNLTVATSNLFDLIQSRQIVLYPNADMRLAVSRAIIVESSRGSRLDKLKQSHKIDVVVALAMSALAAVRGQAEPYFDLDGMLYGRDNPNPDSTGGWRALQLMQHIQRYG